MGCPPVCGDNPRALASGLSPVQVDKQGIAILYHLHQCKPCTSRDISCLSWKGWFKIGFCMTWPKITIPYQFVRQKFD